MNDWISNIPNLPALSKGSHTEDSQEMCAMELVAFMERLPHSDSPTCTCPVLASYVRELNDRMPNDQRQDLKQVLPMLVGTTNPSLVQARAEYFAMQAVTKIVPLALVGIIDQALIDDMRTAENLEDAARASYAARDAADVYIKVVAARDTTTDVASYIAYAAANYITRAEYATNAANLAAFAGDAARDAKGCLALATAVEGAADAAEGAAYAAHADTDAWTLAIQVLIEAIELDPEIKPVQWSSKRIADAVSIA